MPKPGYTSLTVTDGFHKKIQRLAKRNHRSVPAQLDVIYQEWLWDSKERGGS